MDTKHIEDQLKALSEVVYKNKETTERLESNWDLDRKDQSDLINRVGHLEVEQQSLKAEVKNVPSRVKDEMNGVVKPLNKTVLHLIQEVNDLKDLLLRKKIIAVDKTITKNQINETINRKRRWYFLWLY